MLTLTIATLGVNSCNFIAINCNSKKTLTITILKSVKQEYNYCNLKINKNKKIKKENEVYSEFNLEYSSLISSILKL